MIGENITMEECQLLVEDLCSRLPYQLLVEDLYLRLPYGVLYEMI
jgi:hypothetical protein